MNVPLLDLKAQYKLIKEDLEPKLLALTDTQMLVLGKEVEKLEEDLAVHLGVKYALGVSSGTDALLMALMAVGVGAGDEVIVPSFSFFATAGIVSRLGAEPVFIDSDETTYNINPELIESHITAKTKAIMPVHLYGQSADMNKINAIAKAHNLIVVEDAAQAIGTQYKNAQFCGSMGHVAGFSFYPTKNLGGFGESGLVTTNDKDLFTKLKQMRNHGMEPKYHHKFVGGNFRMDAIQALALNEKLPHLDNWQTKRRENAHKYNEIFIEKGLAEKTGVLEFDSANRLLLPKEVYADADILFPHTYHQYVIRSENRDGLRNHLSQNSIGSEIYYPVPLHRQECFESLHCKDENFPVVNRFSREVIALPIYPELTDEQIEYVAGTIEEFIKA